MIVPTLPPAITPSTPVHASNDDWNRRTCRTCGTPVAWRWHYNGVQEWVQYADPATGAFVRDCPGCGCRLG